jgi:hypothetical protein
MEVINMNTRSRPQIRRVLYGLLLVLIILSVLSVNSTPLARAQAAWTATPAVTATTVIEVKEAITKTPMPTSTPIPELVSQGSDIPLYSGLLWGVSEQYTQGLEIPGFQETILLDGYLYKSTPFATKGKPPSELLDFYSSDSMILMGWVNIGYQDSPGSIRMTYYDKTNKRYLDITMEECESDASGLADRIENSFCVKLWNSSNGVSFEPIIPEKIASASFSDDMHSLSYSNPLPVPFFSQRNSDPNKNITLGTGSSTITIYYSGCALTSYAMIYNYYQPSCTTVTALNDSLKVAPGTYSSGNLWPIGGVPDAPSGVSGGQRYINDCSTVNCIDNTASHPFVALIDNELISGRPMHLRVHPSGGAFNSHSVVLIGHVGNDYIIKDPWATDDQYRTLSTGALGGYVVDYIDTVFGIPPGGTPQSNCPNYNFDGVVLWDQDNCYGATLSANGSTGVVNLTDYGWNDRAESIYVKDGWSVRVWQDINAGLATSCIYGSKWDLNKDTYETNSGLSMHRDISSIQVFQNSSCTGAPSAATLSSPSGNINTNYNPTYTWNQVSGVTWYYLWVNGPSGNIIKQWYTSAQANCNGSTCSVTHGTTLAGGAHTWWVQTYNLVGYGPWSAGMSFSTYMPTVPGSASLSSPSGYIGADYIPAYTWNQVSGATWYYLYVDGPSGNVIKQWYTSAQANCNGSTCSLKPGTTLSGGAHTWWILTWNSNGSGPWSVAKSFNTASPMPIPGTATLVSPSGGTGWGSQPTYMWNQVNGSTWYYLWINGPSGTFYTKWYTSDQANCDGSTCSIRPAITLPSGSNRWWVQTWNSSGQGPWSSGIVFYP